MSKHIHNNTSDTDYSISSEIDNDLIIFIKCDIFTPDNICKIMTSKLNNNGSLLEPSVGTGNLLKFINLDNYNIIDVYELKNEYLQQINNTTINKFNTDFLKTTITTKYDNIIMNPPYIRIQDLSISYRLYIKQHFNILHNGLIDIYYAFILKCINLLNDNGRMVAITPNTYLYNKSSLQLRKYLFENQLIEEIIDFKDKKVFKDVSVYCCITIFTLHPKTHLIYNNKHISYEDIYINNSLFNFNKSINTLKDICKITNGIATLRDKIFIHTQKLYDEPCWKVITNGITESFIIYPYDNGTIIDKSLFKSNNPLTYQYLKKYKNELAKRDKGHKTYPTWYAYGRTQSINPPTQPCIYIPCFINPANFEKYIFIKEPTLYKSCLCIQPKNNIDINLIINYLIENITFIERNSTKRSGGWINISSRILYQISIN
jgi:hypothetical protein